MKVSFWLIPKTRQRAAFKGLIANLAAQYGGPLFEPHVTLYSGELAEGESAEDILIKFTGKLRRIDLYPIDIGYSEEYTRTLFIEFAPDPDLDRTLDTIKRLVRKPSDYVLKPHLSLLYADLSMAQKAQLRETVRVPEIRFGVGFDDVWAVATAGGTKTKQDVEGWQVLSQVGI